MSRTVTAMFDSRPEAEAAKSRLNESSIDADRVRIIDKTSTSGSYDSATAPTGSEGQGFWASLKDLFVDDTDRQTYGEGINRGAFLLSAEVDEDQADDAVRILEESDSVDLDQREQGWRSEGWTGFAGADSGFASNASSGFGTDADIGQSYTGTSAATAGGMASPSGDRQSTPTGDDAFRFGRREADRGGSRVRSYVRDDNGPGAPREQSFGDENVRTQGERSAFGGFEDRSTGTTEKADRAEADLEGTNLQDRSKGF